MMTLGYVALGPMLGAIFLPIWGVIALTIANMIGLALAPVFVPAEVHDGAALIGHLSINAMVGVLASLYMHHRNADRGRSARGAARGDRAARAARGAAAPGAEDGGHRAGSRAASRTTSTTC